MSAHKKDPLAAYLTVFVTLLILLALTVFAYHVPFENWNFPGTNIKMTFMNTVVALTIASIKSLLVMLVFMHLRYSTKLTWIIASAGFVWLGIMISFTFADYLSRGAIPEAMKQPISAIRPDETQRSP